MVTTTQTLFYNSKLSQDIPEHFSETIKILGLSRTNLKLQDFQGFSRTVMTMESVINLLTMLSSTTSHCTYALTRNINQLHRKIRKLPTNSKGSYTKLWHNFLTCTRMSCIVLHHFTFDFFF